MSQLPLGILADKVPKHIAIIMDGNGRWAKKLGNIRIFGHNSALTAVREAIEGAIEIGVSYLTLFAFSTENWSRPAFEVNALMELLVSSLKKEHKTFHENRVRLRIIGNHADLPIKCQRELTEVMEQTAHYDQLTLTLALSYGSRQDILLATQKIAQQVVSGECSPQDITMERLSACLATYFLPDPELLIRTSGEYRISNFLLWEIAYSELYITPKLWPDFRRNDLFEAVLDYQQRERRFGKTSEQLNP